ncbi:MAG: hypothetical protein KatS3mg090_0939 [Patescibacteria group bacterium]|nr:MAG: hypothetical protein KatS3mg090_0939 [Patescibacteria group bacterium]
MESELNFSLLKKLISAFGVTGDTDEVRGLIESEIKTYTTYTIDNYGVLLAGELNNPRIVVSAHIDEVGFQIVKKTDSEGYSIAPIGSVSSCSFAGMPVVVKTSKGEKTSAVVYSGANIRSALSSDDFSNLILYPLDKNIVLTTGSLGTFEKYYSESAEYLTATAIDNRVSVFVMLKLLELGFDLEKNKIMFAFITDEEMEDHSADSISARFKPEYALVLDYCPIVKQQASSELWSDSLANDLPQVLYRGGKYLLHCQLRQFFDQLEGEVKFSKSVLNEQTITKLEPSNFEGNGFTKAVNICLPALGYHNYVYTVKKTAVARFLNFIQVVLEKLIR